MMLRVLAMGQFVNVLTGTVAKLLSMTGHERDLRKLALFGGPLRSAWPSRSRRYLEGLARPWQLRAP